MKVIFTILLNIAYLSIFSQNLYTSKIEFIKTNTVYQFDTSPITSLVIKLKNSYSFENAIIKVNDIEYPIEKDIHVEHSLQSKLIIFNKPISNFSLKSGNINDSITIFKIFLKPNSIKIPAKKYITFENCDLLKIVPILEWRKDLPKPKELPIENKVTNIIIHHSAGLNINTNYYEVLRNIYIYHTQINGWNDIGYNYIIAPDGTIFEGRDGQGRLEIDNVLGAHFCNKNTGTMGICLLGNFDIEQPTTIALESLEKLLLWKTKKEKIDVLTKTYHASSDKILKNIANHNDGCITDCPGKYLIQKMDESIAKVSYSPCELLLKFENITKNKNLLFNNPISHTIELNKNAFEAIYNSYGKNMNYSLKYSNNQIELNPKYLINGVYFLRYQNKYFKIIIAN